MPSSSPSRVASRSFIRQTVENIFHRYPYRPPPEQVDTYTKDIDGCYFTVAHILAMRELAASEEYEERAPSSLQLKALAGKARSRERAADKKPHQVSAFEEPDLPRDNPGAVLARQFEEENRRWIIDPGGRPSDQEVHQRRARAIAQLVDDIAMRKKMPEPPPPRKPGERAPQPPTRYPQITPGGTHRAHETEQSNARTPDARATEADTQRQHPPEDAPRDLRDVPGPAVHADPPEDGESWGLPNLPPRQARPSAEG